MEEVTNQVYLQCVRTAVEIVENMPEELLVAEFKHMPIDTQRAICSQYLAKSMYETACESPEKVE